MEESHSDFGSLLRRSRRGALGLESAQAENLVLDHLAVGLVCSSEVGDHSVLDELLCVHQIAGNVVRKSLFRVTLQHAAEKLSALAEVIFVSSLVSGNIAAARFFVPTRRSRCTGAAEPVKQVLLKCHVN